MNESPDQPRFKVDTSRPRSRTKLRSKIRHVLAVAPGQLSARLAAGRIHAARGEQPEALEQIRILEERKEALSRDQRSELEELKSIMALP